MELKLQLVKQFTLLLKAVTQTLDWWKVTQKEQSKQQQHLHYLVIQLRFSLELMLKIILSHWQQMFPFKEQNFATVL